VAQIEPIRGGIATQQGCTPCFSQRVKNVFILRELRKGSFGRAFKSFKINELRNYTILRKNERVDKGFRIREMRFEMTLEIRKAAARLPHSTELPEVKSIKHYICLSSAK
jgi:hypothetical protein